MMLEIEDWGRRRFKPIAMVPEHFVRQGNIRHNEQGVADFRKHSRGIANHKIVRCSQTSCHRNRHRVPGGANQGPSL